MRSRSPPRIPALGGRSSPPKRFSPPPTGPWRPPPLAMSVASTSVTAVAVGDDNAPIGPSLLWMDTRAASEATEITNTQHPCLGNTGGQVSPEWMLPKALWLARHDPARYSAARKIVDVHDWVLFHLTG